MHKSLMNHGMFSWNELLTTDLESAKEFYGKLFGWTFVEEKTIYGDTYLLAFNGDEMAGGMMLKPDCTPAEVKGCWDPYVTVDDVDASVKQVEELGGTVVLTPTEIKNVGRFSVIQDRQGIYLNIISYFPKDQS